MWILNHLIDPLVLAILRSPAHRLLSGRLLVLRLRGRRSGRPIELPVAYVRTADGLAITVGAPERKRWWRNIAVDVPTPVEVVVGGARRAGTARRQRTPGGPMTVHVRLGGD